MHVPYRDSKLTRLLQDSLGRAVIENKHSPDVESPPPPPPPRWCISNHPEGKLCSDLGLSACSR